MRVSTVRKWVCGALFVCACAGLVACGVEDSGPDDIGHITQAWGYDRCDTYCGPTRACDEPCKEDDNRTITVCGRWRYLDKLNCNGDGMGSCPSGYGVWRYLLTSNVCYIDRDAHFMNNTLEYYKDYVYEDQSSCHHGLAFSKHKWRDDSCNDNCSLVCSNHLEGDPARCLCSIGHGPPTEDRCNGRWYSAGYQCTAGPDAQFGSQSVPASLVAGAPATVSVTMRNTGTTTWTAAAGYRLGSQNPQDNATWGFGRVDLAPGDAIAPGGQKVFTFTITAPTTPGSYPFQWRMLREGVGWFGTASTNVIVSVTAQPSANNAAFLGQSGVPTAMTVGQSVTVSLTMQNTGTTTWTAASSYKLGANTAHNWGTSGRLLLAGGESVAPGAQKTFTFIITAPTTAGSYPFQWRMLREGVEWFGTASTNVIISVTAQPSANNATFASQSGVPAALAAGQTATVSVTMRNTGTTTWTRATSYRLGSQNPPDNSTWGLSRIDLAANDSIAPGAQKTFTFTIVAPATAGTYAFQWRMLREGVEWFGAASPNVDLEVVADREAKGWLDGVGAGGWAFGWACDQDVPSQSIEVHFWTCDWSAFLGKVTANAASEAAITAECGGGYNHRFGLTLPSSANGQCICGWAMDPVDSSIGMLSGSCSVRSW
jgi:hypothetical protein